MIVSLYSVRPNALADRTSAWTLLLSSQDWRTPELLGRWEDLLKLRDRVLAQPGVTLQAVREAANGH